MVELIISEKPSSARKIAEALADAKPVQKKHNKSSYFEIQHKKKPIVVASAVGHLYGLVEREKNGWRYPVFDIVWEATYKSSKELKYAQDYLETITLLAKEAKEFTIACDYDIEGEVIGLNVIRFACRQKDANRMKFSTLTEEDLVEAYEQKRHHLDWGQAYAGEARHKLDWFYGINLSRALTASVKAAGSFKIMSAGRVQGPALKILVEREKEIAAFVSEPFWEIHLSGKYAQEPVEAIHCQDKIFQKEEVSRILTQVAGAKEALVKEVKRTTRNQAAPFPFDLTSLQSEAYNQFKITPKETLELAQALYLAGVTSYPRTSSQQLNPKVGFAKILKGLGKQPAYEKLCNSLLQLPSLTPNNGKKTDPAHPAIYPTGMVPKTLKEREKKIYDLVVRRFMATFGEAALRETMEVFLDVNSEPFVAKGTRTVKENWHIYYRPYLKLNEIALPNMKEGENVIIRKITKEDKETQAPKRYNQSSIIKELEKRNLGTKATRAEILDRLFQRGYIEGVQISVTKLGMETITILEKYAPTIIDERLTAHFEEGMEQIREGKITPEQVLEEAKEALTSILADFKKKEKQVGKEILVSIRETAEIQNYVGVCRKCGEGKLMIRRGKFGSFIACDRYPHCATTFTVPSGALIKGAGKECEQCGYPRITIIKKGKRPGEACINLECSSKVREEDRELLKKFETGELKRNCPKCGKGLIVRRSFFNVFLGCPDFPKCRHLENLDGSRGWKRKGKK